MILVQRSAARRHHGSPIAIRRSPVARRHVLPDFIDSSVISTGVDEHHDERESVIMADRGSVAIVHGTGLVLMSSTDTPGEALIAYDDADFDMLLCVDHGVYLVDGDLIGAGQCWFRYTCGDDVHSPQLQVLDSDGSPRTSVLVREGSLSIGREIGDLILSREGLAAVHLRIEYDQENTVLINLAGPSRTWLQVCSGDVVPSDSVLAIGERIVKLCPTPLANRERQPSPGMG